MNKEARMKLQSFLDGELPLGEAARLSDWLATDPEARALLDELTNTNAALKGHEAEIKLPEARDFYWSKIKGQIERESRVAAPVRRFAWAGWAWRGLIPAGAVGLACLMVFHSGNSGASPEFSPELELASDDVGAYTFKSQETGLTTVWIYNRGAESGFTPAANADSLKQ